MRGVAVVRCLVACPRGPHTLNAANSCALSHPTSKNHRHRRWGLASTALLSSSYSSTTTNAQSNFCTALPNMSSVGKPNLPLRFDDVGGTSNDTDSSSTTAALDLSAMAAVLTQSQADTQAAYDTSRTLKATLIDIRDQIGTPEAAVALQDLLTKTHTDLLLQQQPQHGRRLANLSDRLQDMVCLSAYQHFLETGGVLPPVPWATDDEYLAGLMGLVAHDLLHYGLGRATVRDVASVQSARAVVSACLDYFLSLDFRNGPLRRKYDATKYSLKGLETLLYELAVTTTATTDGTEEKDEESSSAEPRRNSKRAKHNDQEYNVDMPMAELIALKERMVHRDELREKLIKKCRDGQKAAKQSIFSLHRGDKAGADELLKQCRALIKDELLPIVQEDPQLRAGSFGNVIEEYVEARLFSVWLHGEGGDDRTNGDANMDDTASSDLRPNGIVLPQAVLDEEILPLLPEDYIGGLCDLTGEIGRYAVKCGTSRHVEGVRACLATNASILKVLSRIDPPKSQKKLDAVRQSVKKLERMLYELSLSQAAARHVQSSVEDMDESNDNPPQK